MEDPPTPAQCQVTLPHTQRTCHGHRCAGRPLPPPGTKQSPAQTGRWPGVASTGRLQGGHGQATGGERVRGKQVSGMVCRKREGTAVWKGS